MATRTAPASSPPPPATGGAAPLVALRDVCFGYGAEPVLDGIDLAVERGEFLGLLGPNGSGKSTLLKIVLGLLRPQAGEVTLFGRPAARFKDRWRLGYVPQRLATFDAQFPATVAEVVEMGRYARLGPLRRLGAADREAVERALEAVEMTPYRDRRIGRLSVGQQQRAFIARALAGDAELLILDEPTAAVDAAAQEAFYHLLEHLNDDFGLTIVLVEHDLGMVAAHVDEVAVLNRRIIFRGAPEAFAQADFLHGFYTERTTGEVHPHAHRHARRGDAPDEHRHPLRERRATNDEGRGAKGEGRGAKGEGRTSDR